MEIIHSSAGIIQQLAFDEIGILKHIELIGRVCYKSEDKISDTSYKQFTDMLMNNKHNAMLEHGTAYFTMPDIPAFSPIKEFFKTNRYSVVDEGTPPNCARIRAFYVTTNYRVLVENKKELDAILSDWQQYLIEPSHHVRRYTVKFICNRGISHEFVRNRGSMGNAFAQESTRYCSYSGKGCTYIYPEWLKPEHKLSFEAELFNNEVAYDLWTRMGYQPQFARDFLNHHLKTELCITAYLFDWKDFFRLRDDSHSHPAAQFVAHKAHELLSTMPDFEGKPSVGFEG